MQQHSRPCSAPRGRFLRHITVLLLLLTLAMAAPCSAAKHSTDHGKAPYILGVFPFVPPANIEGLFAPIAAELSAAIGRPVILRTTESYDKFMTALEQREYDIAFVQPFDYVEIAKPKGYLPLARRSEDLSSSLVVKSDSPLVSTHDLKGKILGMPPAVAAVSILNRIALNKAGLRPEKDLELRHFSSHQACLQQLLVGTVHACGVAPSGIKLVETQLKTTFKEIGRSPSIPHTLFVARQKLPHQEISAMRKVLLETSLQSVPMEYRVIFVTPGAKPFRSAKDSDYDSVRRHLKGLKRR